MHVSEAAHVSKEALFPIYSEVPAMHEDGASKEFHHTARYQQAYTVLEKAVGPSAIAIEIRFS